MSKLLVIAFSAGGLALAQRILAALPADYPLPVVIILHLPAARDSCIVELLQKSTLLPVSMAADKAPIRPARVYVAPPDYHLLVERDGRFGLSVDPPVKSVRPSIDVFLESAAEAYEHRLIAVILSGANSDGMHGMACVKELGGVTIVLDPMQSEFHVMPAAVVNAVDVDYVASPAEIISLLLAAGDA